MSVKRNDLTKGQQKLVEKIEHCEPPVVAVAVGSHGLGYRLGDGRKVNSSMVKWLITIGVLASNGDTLFSDMSPQSYRVNL